ncbi:GntR family transcriptional regulator [Rhizobium sp. L1K21]|uniref:GntR family transcriptional regulator n=1 Tax=Rhizobium sp. L1K21 TaxID=2954933 RepID=UPI0020920436|nr:GntR family transcriptional regulator [Rhizobium sp. L1K21]MCO6186807.1 GntR family transcriptional regulator [Rhizobium sp. L1K21]
MVENAAASTQTVSPLKRETFSDRIAADLRRAIIIGEIEAGEPITEVELASRFGVSRGPLREALGILAGEGLVVSVPYTGTRVLKLTAKDVRELYSLRTSLESLAFKEIWYNRDANFATEMEARHKRLLATQKLSDHVASSEAEVKFHALVYERCGHKLLLESWQRIASRLQLYLAVHQRAHGRTAPIEDAHERYVQLALGDRLDLMLDEVESHMQRGILQMERYLGD